jgi:hypothetical protein
MQRVVISEYDEQGNSTTGMSAQNAFAVVPSDAADLGNGATRGLYVGVTGDVSAVMTGGNTVTFTGLSAGIVHPISVGRIRATGTTATGILAVY